MSQKQGERACQFDQVYKDELRYIQRRRKSNVDSGEATDQDGENTQENLIGLALSGGGIRSATTCLGMLQEFSKMGILPMVDYLSTVSGGGYIGSCLSALLSVNKDSVQAAGKSEQYHFKGWEDSLFTTAWENFPFQTERNKGQYGQLTGEAEVKHLRTHGNFLMARQGLFARETMRSVGNLLTGIAYHLLIVLLFLFSLSALYMATLYLLAPGIENVLGTPPATTTTTTETTVETTPQSTGATTIFVDKRTVSQNPTLWEQLQQKGQILRASVPQLKDKPFALALILGVGLSLMAFLWLWKAMANYQAQPLAQRAAPEPGDSAEDYFERSLLKKVGLVSVAIAILGVIVIRWEYAPTLVNQDLVLWLLLPLTIFVGARLMSIFISALLPHLGERSKLLWSRNFRSLWGSFQAITTYGLVFCLATALFPFLIYTLVVQQTLGVGTGLGGTVLSLVSSRLLAKRLTEVPEEKKKISPELMRFALGVAVGLFLLLIVLQFCILIALYNLSPWFHLAWSLLLFLVVGFGVDFNKLALHYFYRDRLIETYLRTEVDKGNGQMALLFDAMEMPLMHLHGTKANLAEPEKEKKRTPTEQIWGCTAPYHLLNTAINLAGSRDLTRKDRKSGYFLFSKFYCGSAQTDYQPTAQYRKGESKLALAATISGAAAASAMGYNTFFAQAFTMTLFNLRLGYWLENPRSPMSIEREERGVFWPWYLFREMFVKTAAPRGRLVNLSDGGHTGDNVGICPLLERRCKVIIACDAECDPALTFGSFTKALRQAYIDWGIDIDIDLSMIRQDAQTGYSRSHCAIGRIYYPDRPAQKSWLIYLKNSLTSDEPDPVENYKADHPTFPHESTADQFFDDDQFESYRALGVHIAQHTFADWVTSSAFKDLQTRHSPFQPEIEKLNEDNEDEAWARLLYLHLPFQASDSPEFQRLTEALIKMEQLFLADKDLGAYYAESYLQQAQRTEGQSEITSKSTHACMMQIQLMEQVFFALRLDRYANALDNRGWMNLFRRWGNAATFQQQFEQLQTTFSSDFVTFYLQYIKSCQPIEDAPLPHPWDPPNYQGLFLDPGRK